MTHSFDLAINEIEVTPPSERAVRVGWLIKQKLLPVFLIGRNSEALAVAACIKVAGIVDDFTQGGDSWHGLKVYRMADIPSDSILINCSTSISPVDVETRATSAGHKNVVSYSELMGQLPALKTPWFSVEMKESVSQDAQRWRWLYDLLADEESKETLLDLVKYRLSANPSYMADYRVRPQEQYFEQFLELSSETFVDAGGFDGDTTDIFCRIDPDYRQVYFFEPSDSNMARAKARLFGMPRICFFSQGLSDSAGRLGFDPSAGSASAVSDIGSLSIEVTTLDRALELNASFIKMDLEGWELPALKGATRHIRSGCAKLAIAVYHAAHDFLLIPEFVLGECSAYDVYLRHYTQGWSETVMYFRPKS